MLPFLLPSEPVYMFGMQCADSNCIKVNQKYMQIIF